VTRLWRAITALGLVALAGCGSSEAGQSPTSSSRTSPPASIDAATREIVHSSCLDFVAGIKWRMLLDPQAPQARAHFNAAVRESRNAAARASILQRFASSVADISLSLEPTNDAPTQKQLQELSDIEFACDLVGDHFPKA
jgi:hypothetical protein